MTLPEVPLKGKIAGVLGLCAMSFVIGHGTRKTIEVEHIREVEKTAEVKVAQAKAETVVAKQAAAKTETRWRTVTVYQPGGEVTVTKYVDREVQAEHSEQAAKVVERVVTQEKVVFKDREVVRAAPGPRWSVGARAGLNLDGKLQYGGDLGRRLVGGLWITAGADVPNRAALVGLRWEF